MLCFMKDYTRDPAAMIGLGNKGDGVFVLHSALEIVDQHGNDLAFRQLLLSVCCQGDAKSMAAMCSS